MGLGLGRLGGKEHHSFPFNSLGPIYYMVNTKARQGLSQMIGMTNTVANEAEAEQLLQMDKKGRLVKQRRKQMLNLRSLVKGHGFGSTGSLWHVEVFQFIEVTENASMLHVDSVLLPRFEQESELAFQNVAFYSCEQSKAVLNICKGMTVSYCQHVLSGNRPVRKLFCCSAHLRCRASSIYKQDLFIFSTLLSHYNSAKVQR